VKNSRKFKKPREVQGEMKGKLEKPFRTTGKSKKLKEISGI
jgi:hypothetical protein